MKIKKFNKKESFFDKLQISLLNEEKLIEAIMLELKYGDKFRL